MSHPSNFYPISRCYHNLEKDGTKLRFTKRFYIDMYTSSKPCSLSNQYIVESEFQVLFKLPRNGTRYKASSAEHLNLIYGH
jgi:hypothetical protein